MVSLTMRRRELLAAVGAAGVVGDGATQTVRGSLGTPWPSFQRTGGNLGLHPNSSGPTSGFESELIVESENVVGSPILAEGTLFVSTSGGIVAVDPSTGTEQWRGGPDPGRTRAPVLYRDGRVYVSSDGDAHLRALDAETGDRIWMKEIGRGAPAYEPTNDVVFLAGYGLDPATGEKRWRAETSDRDNLAPAVGNGRIYFLDQDRNLVAVDASDGTTAWTQSGHHTASATFAGTASYTPMVLCIVDYSRVVAYSADDGAELWTSPDLSDGEDITTSVGVTPSGGALAVVTYVDARAVYLQDGSIAWETETESALHTPPAIVDGVAYAAGEGTEDRFTAIDVTEGTVLESSTVDRTRWGASPVVHDGTAYLAGWQTVLRVDGDGGGGGESVDLLLDMEGGTATAGGEVTISYRLTNEGDATATGLQGLIDRPSEAWEVIRAGEFTSLDPGETETATISFEVPADASGEYEFGGIVEDDADNGARDTATVTVEAVTGEVGVDIDLVAAGESADVTFSVATDGDLPEELTVLFRGPESGPNPLSVRSAGEEVDTFRRRRTDEGLATDASLLVDDVTDGEYPLRFEVLTGEEVSVGETVGTLRVNNAPLVAAGLGDSYGVAAERALNPSWWRDQAREASQEALEALKPDLGDLATETVATTVGEFAGSTMASVVSALVTILDQLTSLFVAYNNDRVADVMDTGSGTGLGSTLNDDIRETLESLEANADELSETTDADGRTDLFENRRRDLERLQDDFASYVLDARELVRGGPALSFGHYATVRVIVEELRLLAVADYAATRSWVDGEPRNLAVATGEPLWYTIHPGNYRSRLLGAMNFAADYMVVEIRVEEASDGDGLEVDVGAPPEVLDAGLSASLASSRGGSGEALERKGNRLEYRGESVEAGRYYLTVEAEGTVGPFEISARTRPSPLYTDAVPISKDETAWEQRDPSADVDGASSATPDAALADEYRSVPEAEEGSRPVEVTPGDPERYAVEAKAGERLSAAVDDEAAASLELYVDRLTGGGMEELAGTGASNGSGSVVVDVPETDTYYVSLYATADGAEAAIGGAAAPVGSVGMADSPALSTRGAAALQGSTVETELEIETQTADRPLPKAVLDGPPEPAAREEVTLDGTGSVAPGGEIETYEWDLDGDGEFEATGETVTHRFPEAGEVTVRLRVTDDAGWSDVTAVGVDVQPSDVTLTPTDGDGGLPSWLGPGALAVGGGLYRYLADEEEGN